MGKRKKLKVKLIIVLSIVIFLIICAIVIIYGFKITKVKIVGNAVCTEDEIKDHYLNGPLGNNKLVIMLKDRFDCFGDVPFIRDEDITFTGKNEVTIQVYEKSLVACFYYMGQYIFFDKDGMILAEDSKKKESVPCIEGIAFTNFTLNESIQVSEKGQIDTILDISELIAHYNIYVEKVSFSNKGEVTLYCGDIRVLLGKKDLYDQQIASVSDVLKQAKEKKLSGSIDLKNYSQGDKIILKR